MSALQAEVFEAFRAIDVPEDKAIRAAAALSSALSRVEDDAAKGFARRDGDAEIFRKDAQSLKVDVGAIREDARSLRVDVDATRKDVQALKVDVAVLKWMVGFVIAMQVVVLFKEFTH